MARRQNGEGTYGKKTINGIVYFSYRFPKDRKQIYARTQKELKEKISTYNNEKTKKEIPKSDVIFEDLCDFWLKNVIRFDISERTYDDYEHIIDKRVKNTDIAKLQANVIDEEVLKDFIKDLTKKYSRASITKTWAVVKQVVNYGIEQNKINIINLKNIKMPKEQQVAVQKKEIQFIDLEDMELLYQETLRTNGNSGLYYGINAKVLVFIMYSGLRISEAVGLTWKYVSNDFSEITVAKAATVVYERDDDLNVVKNSDGTNKRIKKQKNPKSEMGERIIPLPERAIEILKYCYENGSHNPDDYVFKSNKNTKLDKDNVGRTLHRVLKRSECKCKDYTLHSLRHGYGSVLIQNGIDISIVSKILGHSNIATTSKIYIHILKNDVSKSVRNIFDKKKDTN